MASAAPVQPAGGYSTSSGLTQTAPSAALPAGAYAGSVGAPFSSSSVPPPAAAFPPPAVLPAVGQFGTAPPPASYAVPPPLPSSYPFQLPPAASSAQQMAGLGGATSSSSSSSPFPPAASAAVPPASFLPGIAVPNRHHRHSEHHHQATPVADSVHVMEITRNPLPFSTQSTPLATAAYEPFTRSFVWYTRSQLLNIARFGSPDGGALTSGTFASHRRKGGGGHGSSGGGGGGGGSGACHSYLGFRDLYRAVGAAEAGMLGTDGAGGGGSALGGGATGSLRATLTPRKGCVLISLAGQRALVTANRALVFLEAGADGKLDDIVSLMTASAMGMEVANPSAESVTIGRKHVSTSLLTQGGLPMGVTHGASHTHAHAHMHTHHEQEQPEDMSSASFLGFEFHVINALLRLAANDLATEYAELESTVHGHVLRVKGTPTETQYGLIQEAATDVADFVLGAEAILTAVTDVLEEEEDVESMVLSLPATVTVVSADNMQGGPPGGAAAGDEGGQGSSIYSATAGLRGSFRTFSKPLSSILAAATQQQSVNGSVVTLGSRRGSTPSHRGIPDFAAAAAAAAAAATAATTVGRSPGMKGLSGLGGAPPSPSLAAAAAADGGGGGGGSSGGEGATARAGFSHLLTEDQQQQHAAFSGAYAHPHPLTQPTIPEESELPRPTRGAATDANAEEFPPPPLATLPADSPGGDSTSHSQTPSSPSPNAAPRTSSRSPPAPATPVPPVEGVGGGAGGGLLVVSGVDGESVAKVSDAHKAAIAEAVAAAQQQQAAATTNAAIAAVLARALSDGIPPSVVEGGESGGLAGAGGAGGGHHHPLGKGIATRQILGPLLSLPSPATALRRTRSMSGNPLGGAPGGNGGGAVAEEGSGAKAAAMGNINTNAPTDDATEQGAANDAAAAAAVVNTLLALQSAPITVENPAWKDEVIALEELLEWFASEAEHRLGQARLLQAELAGERKRMALVLAANRNRLLLVQTAVQASTMGLSMCTVVSGYFGMNLNNGVSEEWSHISWIVVVTVSLFFGLMLSYLVYKISAKIAGTDHAVSGWRGRGGEPDGSGGSGRGGDGEGRRSSSFFSPLWRSGGKWRSSTKRSVFDEGRVSSSSGSSNSDSSWFGGLRFRGSGGGATGGAGVDWIGKQTSLRETSHSVKLSRGRL